MSSSVTGAQLETDRILLEGPHSRRRELWLVLRDSVSDALSGKWSEQVSPRGAAVATWQIMPPVRRIPTVVLLMAAAVVAKLPAPAGNSPRSSLLDNRLLVAGIVTDRELGILWSRPALLSPDRTHLPQDIETNGRVGSCVDTG